MALDSTVSVPPGSPEQTHAAVPPAIAVAVGLSKTYGTGDAAVTALDEVSVEFARGGLTAIMGPSGSGKSTLMHCLAALDSRRDRLAPCEAGSTKNVQDMLRK